MQISLLSAFWWIPYTFRTSVQTSLTSKRQHSHFLAWGLSLGTDAYSAHPGGRLEVQRVNTPRGSPQFLTGEIWCKSISQAHARLRWENWEVCVLWWFPGCLSGIKL